MSHHRRRHPPSGARGAFALAGAAGAAALMDVAFLGGHAALDLYFVPMLVGAALLGRRGGLYATILVAGTVGAVAMLEQRLPARPFDLATWAAALALTAWVVGSLQDRRRLRRRALREAHQTIRDLLERLLAVYGQPTENHAWHVSEAAVETAHALAMADDEVEALRAAAWLHELSDSEDTFAALRRAGGSSPDAGPRGFLERVVEIVTLHRERWDGSGPRGIAGDDIPLAARILAITDAWDAAAAERPAGPRIVTMIGSEAADVLRRGAGTQFDPDLVEVFVRLQSRRERAAA